MADVAVTNEPLLFVIVLLSWMITTDAIVLLADAFCELRATVPTKGLWSHSHRCRFLQEW